MSEGRSWVRHIEGIAHRDLRGVGRARSREQTSMSEGLQNHVATPSFALGR